MYNNHNIWNSPCCYGNMTLLAFLYIQMRPMSLWLLTIHSKSRKWPMSMWIMQESELDKTCSCTPHWICNFTIIVCDGYTYNIVQHENFVYSYIPKTIALYLPIHTVQSILQQRCSHDVSVGLLECPMMEHEQHDIGYGCNIMGMQALTYFWVELMIVGFLRYSLVSLL